MGGKHRSMWRDRDRRVLQHPHERWLWLDPEQGGEMSDPDNRSCVLEGDSIGPLHGSAGVVEGEGLQISDMSSWGNESAFSRNRETKEGVDYGRWKLSQEGSQGYMWPKERSAEARNAGVSVPSGRAMRFPDSRPACFDLLHSGSQNGPGRRMYFSLPPLTMPTEHTEIPAHRREMIFNWLLLFLFQNHPGVLNFRIQLESKELIVNLERNK